MNPKRIALAAICAAATCGAAQAAEITIYKQPQFTGGDVTLTNATRDLTPLGITDQASSLVVRGGSWEVCTQPEFAGDCRTLAPGRYATLDASLNHRIESARQVEQQARGRDRDRYARGRDSRDETRGYQPDGDYGNRAYDNRDYGSRDYGSPGYGNPDYANRDYGNRDYGNRDRSDAGSAWRP